MLVKFTGILWDTDGKKCDAPSGCTLDVEDDRLRDCINAEEVGEVLSDLLSDEFGWCVDDYSWAFVPMNEQERELAAELGGEIDERADMIVRSIEVAEDIKKTAKHGVNMTAEEEAILFSFRDHGEYEQSVVADLVLSMTEKELTPPAELLVALRAACDDILAEFAEEPSPL